MCTNHHKDPTTAVRPLWRCPWGCGATYGVRPYPVSPVARICTSCGDVATLQGVWGEGPNMDVADSAHDVCEACAKYYTGTDPFRHADVCDVCSTCGGKDRDACVCLAVLP